MAEACRAGRYADLDEQIYEWLPLVKIHAREDAPRIMSSQQRMLHQQMVAACGGEAHPAHPLLVRRNRRRDGYELLSDTDYVAALREAKVLLVPCVVERTEEEQVPFVTLRELARQRSLTSLELGRSIYLYEQVYCRRTGSRYGALKHYIEQYARCTGRSLSLSYASELRDAYTVAEREPQLIPALQHLDIRLLVLLKALSPDASSILLECLSMAEVSRCVLRRVVCRVKKGAAPLLAYLQEVGDAQARARLAFHFHLDVTSIDGALPQMLAEPEPEVQADPVVLGEKLAHYAGFDGVRQVA